VNVLPVQADISKKSGIDKIVNTCKKLSMPVSILVNNAGQMLSKPFAKITEKEIQAVYQTNVFAPFLLRKV